MRCCANRPNTWMHPTGAHRCTKALAPQGLSTHGPTTTAVLHSYAGAGAVHAITSVPVEVASTGGFTQPEPLGPEVVEVICSGGQRVRLAPSIESRVLKVVPVPGSGNRLAGRRLNVSGSRRQLPPTCSFEVAIPGLGVTSFLRPRPLAMANARRTSA